MSASKMILAGLALTLSQSAFAAEPYDIVMTRLEGNLECSATEAKVMDSFECTVRISGDDKRVVSMKPTDDSGSSYIGTDGEGEESGNFLAIVADSNKGIQGIGLITANVSEDKTEVAASFTGVKTNALDAVNLGPVAIRQEGATVHVRTNFSIYSKNAGALRANGDQMLARRLVKELQPVVQLMKR